MGRGRPLRPAQGRAPGEMAEDLRDHGRLLDERDDAHGSGASGTREWIDFKDLRDEASTSSAERRAHARLAAALDTALNSSMVDGSSGRVFRRFPRVTLLQGDWRDDHKWIY